jgi:hypothetical protein
MSVVSSSASTWAAGSARRARQRSLPGYALGDLGRPSHFAITIPRDVAAAEARALAVGDAAFVLRSDGT